MITRHGMSLVLILLCLFFSAVTVREDNPSGAKAGEALARSLGNRPTPANLLVVTRGTDEDKLMVAALAAAVTNHGWNIVGVAEGGPREAREILDRLNEAKTTIDAIATTPECATWTLLQGIRDRFKNLGSPAIRTPASSRWPVFLTRQNLLNVADQIVVVAILSAGLTFVILTGGIDLSVGSLIALAAVLATRIVHDQFGGPQASIAGLLTGTFLALLFCAGFGLISGAVVVQFKLPPFIATLALMQAASGLAFILAKGQSIYELPESTTWLGRGTGLFGLPHAVLLMILVFAAAQIILTRTVLGRQIYAVGGNETAARLSGVPTGRVKLFAYVTSATLAGLGGIVMASQLKSGSPTYGTSYELYAVAAVVVGGTSLNGGEGSVIGTLVGAFIIAVINNGMNLTGVESYTQKVVLGLVILTAVMLDRLKHRFKLGKLRPKSAKP